MNEEVKDYQPHPLANPFLALDFGEKIGSRMGELGQRVAQVEWRLDRVESKIDALDAKFESKIDALDAKFESKIDALDAKFEARTDKLMVLVSRLDERTRNQGRLLVAVGGATLATVLAGLALQLLR